MATTKTTQNNPNQQPQRRKRLSRKEQKARKKQRKLNEPKDLPSEESQHRHEAEACPSVPQQAIQGDNNDNKKNKKNDAYEEEVDFLSDYTPTPIPESADTTTTTATEGASASSSSLGKWFPKARVIKSLTAPTSNAIIKNNNNIKDKKQLTTNQQPEVRRKASILLFYQYASCWSESRASHLLSYLACVAKARPNLGGRIRVAAEGVNATISAIDWQDDSQNSNNKTLSSQRTLRHFCEDLRRFDPTVFAKTDFKFIDNVTSDRHFKDLKLLPVKELVFYGFREEEAPLDRGGVHVDPNRFHELLEQDSTVVVDVRNHYEAAIGRFDGQEKTQKKNNNKTGATYLDPKMRKSTDFTSWLAKPTTQQQLQNKTVLMYCTGGVRCERASAYLNTQMGEQVKGVYQLEGGIEKYLQAFPDGGHWRGKNFVFDKREATSAENRNGDGGVIQKQKKKKKQKAKQDVQAKCCVCDCPWDRYVGKKKCYTCGVPVLMCDSCMSCKDNDGKARCPLCVEENITVAAAEVEYTNNGVDGRLSASGDTKDVSKKAAPSVLKWGGGHAQQKKMRKRLKSRMCQFGRNCVRPNCFFLHPTEEASS